jgi:hypothetical protein
MDEPGPRLAKTEADRLGADMGLRGASTLF